MPGDLVRPLSSPLNFLLSAVCLSFIVSVFIFTVLRLTSIEGVSCDSAPKGGPPPPTSPPPHPKEPMTSSLVEDKEVEAWGPKDPAHGWGPRPRMGPCITKIKYTIYFYWRISSI